MPNDTQLHGRGLHGRQRSSARQGRERTTDGGSEAKAGSKRNPCQAISRQNAQICPGLRWGSLRELPGQLGSPVLEVPQLSWKTHRVGCGLPPERTGFLGNQVCPDELVWVGLVAGDTTARTCLDDLGTRGPLLADKSSGC